MADKIPVKAKYGGSPLNVIALQEFEPTDTLALAYLAAPGVSGGDVITWGGSPLGWIPAAPSISANKLDELSDVVITQGSPLVDNDVLAFDKTSGNWINKTAEQAGLVAGPASSTNNAVIRWNGATGALVQDSGVTVDDNDNVVVPGSIKISTASSPIVSGVMTVEDVNGQPIMCMEDTSRSNKKLSIETVNITWSEPTLTNYDWLQIGSATDADISYIAPYDGTIIVATGYCENNNTNTKDIKLYINTTLNGTAMGTFGGGSPVGSQQTFNTTLNIDFAAGDRIRLRAWTGGIIQDTVVTLWIKWRSQ